jgi:signal peptidase I
VGSAIKIEGSSMAPVLQNQERIIILKMSFLKKRINRFDIIVFFHPRKPDQKLIKRVIGLPNEQLEIKEGRVWINNRPIEYPTPITDGGDDYPLTAMKPLWIPEDHYFVIGDNRKMSQDSREFGPIDIHTIIGEAFFRYWPFSRFGRIS